MIGHSRQQGEEEKASKDKARKVKGMAGISGEGASGQEGWRAVHDDHGGQMSPFCSTDLVPGAASLMST